MKKIVLFLALIGATLGVNAATASAANCTFVNSTTYYSAGMWHFNTQAQNCIDVDQVESTRCTTQGCSGWYDRTKGVSHIAQSCCNLDVQYWGRIGVPLTNSAVQTWNIYPWCAGNYNPGAVFAATNVSVWRIHRLATQTWGQYVVVSRNENIGC